MSIQYTVPGFKPTTFGTRVSSHNHQTRAPAPQSNLHIMASQIQVLKYLGLRKLYLQIYVFHALNRVSNNVHQDFQSFMLKYVEFGFIGKSIKSFRKNKRLSSSETILSVDKEIRPHQASVGNGEKYCLEKSQSVELKCTLSCFVNLISTLRS